MQKLSTQSKDLSQENIKKIEELFPNCVTETYDEKGNLVRSIDFDILRQDLSDHIVEGPKERYQFNWPGKREAILLANAPTTNTLRPLPEKSVDFENTKNVYIEGDNLEALKILRETYMGKIKMIYIDPPYNTGNDFVYKDDFKESTEEYLKSSGDIDEEGNRMEVNGESNGRFHSDWLNMMYPRLVLARDLLRDDGVIFISMDEHEYPNLRKISDDVFGEQNFIAGVVWERAYSPVNLMKHFSPSHDYIAVYGKNMENTICNGLPRDKNADDRYSNPDNDPRGPWKSSDLSVGPAVLSNIYEITTPSGRKVLPPSGYSWRLSQDKFEEFVKDKRIWFGPKGDNVPSIKRFLSSVKQGITPMTIWKYTEVGHSQEASQHLKKIFDNKAYFDYPKPVSLIQRCIQLYCNNDSIVMDFFSGSATTAESVFKQNANNNQKCRFILVQFPEFISEEKEAYKDGYRTICDIGEERIRRAGKKIKESSPLTTQNLDVGFRVYKVDSSNMKDIQSTPQNTQLSLLQEADSAIKPDRTAMDLVIQVMLQLGITLDAEIKKGTCMNGATYYAINGNDLVCCFDKNISESDIEEIARMKPLNVAFRDDSFASDQDAVNCEQSFKTLSPMTGKNIFVL